MKKQLLSFIILLLTITSYSQNKSAKSKTIGISIPIIWNNTEGVYYSLGSKKSPKGTSISHGINTVFTKTFYKNWYIIIGAGYFNQSFKISRPFDFDGDLSSNLLYSTKSYQYHSIKLEAGFGYKYKVSENLGFNFFGTYNYLKSFKQKYVPTGLSGGQFKPYQVNNKNLAIGNMISVAIGAEKKISKSLTLGIDFLFPILVKWNDDKTFTEYFYSNDSRKIGINKLSIGLNISCKYHF